MILIKNINQLEFEIVMEHFNLSKDERNGYTFNDLQIYRRRGKYYVTVNGNVPYELAKHIYNKYDNEEYAIRVNGNSEYESPKDDVSTYHIDTIEGLVAFLYEVGCYYDKTKSNSKDLENIIDDIYKDILKRSDAKTSIYDWMLDHKNKKEFFKTVLSTSSVENFKLRKKVEKFDALVNPFASSMLEIEDSSFRVKGYHNDVESMISLRGQNDNITMGTIKDGTGFVAKVSVEVDEPFGVYLYHYFDGEEIFAFEVYDSSGLMRYEYNFTHNTFGEQYGVKHPINGEDKKRVIEILDKYNCILLDFVKKNTKQPKGKVRKIKSTNQK